MNCSLFQRFAFGVSILALSLSLAVVVWIFFDTVFGKHSIHILRSKDLDAVGANYGLQRRRWGFGLLCEPDRAFRARIRVVITGRFNAQPGSYQ